MAKLKGFFKLKSTEKPEIRSLVKYNKPGSPDCSSCDLHKVGNHPKIELRGEGRLKILIIAEGPDQAEGEVKDFFEAKLKPLGIDLNRDCKIINAVNCKAFDKKGKSRKATREEIKFCRPAVLKAIEEFKPKVTWLMGGQAVTSYYMDKFSKLSITRWLRWVIPDAEKGSWVLPIYHPSFPYKTRDKNKNLNSEYDRLLKTLVSETKKLIKKPRPIHFDWKKQVTPLYEYDHIIEHLKYILREKPSTTIDFETTGKKPHKPGHRIVIVGLDDGVQAVAFPFQVLRYWTEKQLNSITFLLKQIIKDPDIKKTAQNMKFEMVWAEVILNIVGQGWDWCTMINTHILETRHDITGLKFQTYVKFGVHGYDKEIAHFLKSEKDEEFNRIDEAPLDKLLLYCGGDCVFTRMLRQTQEQQLVGDEELKRAVAFYRDSLRSLANMQKIGIPTSKQYYLEEKDRLTKRIKTLERRVNNSPDTKTFRKRTGRAFKINSGKDLQYLLFDIKKIKHSKKTKTGYSTDIEALEKIDTPFTKTLLIIRKLKKIRDTYLAQFLREVYDDRIHAFCNLHIARSLRSSMTAPNFQNIPRREELAKKAVRSGIIPSKGNRLSENDFGSHEVRLAACYSEDPVLIKYIIDPKGTDMHRDQGAEIFILDQSLIHTLVRFYIKNNWVFPEFYGSWYKQCAQNLWQNVVLGGLKTNDGITMKEHLLSVDLRTYSQFENHCKKIEKIFWDKYKVFKKWQDKVLNIYLEKGYAELFHGFKRTGFLSKNQIINTPVQGSAFHCLLWSLNRVDRIAVVEEWLSSIINQVHDSIKFDLNPHEQDHVTHTLKRVAEVDIREEFKWIIVPLEIEVEFTPIDGNWYQKEAVNWIDNSWIGKDSKKIYNLEC